MEKLLGAHSENPYALKNSIRELNQEKPAPLANKFVHMDKDEVVQQHISRFNI